MQAITFTSRKAWRTSKTPSKNTTSASSKDSTTRASSDPDTLAVHCIHIDDHEIDLLKDSGCFVVHNPESNMGNAVGCPPVLDIVHKGITAGLGTDGYTSDMFESYKVANILHKHNTGDPNAAWGEIPQMLFENNRKIAEHAFNRKPGVIEPGAQADIIVSDYIPTTPMNEGNINSHVVFGMNGRSIVDTMCDGRLLMKDRELIGIDEEAENGEIPRSGPEDGGPHQPQRTRGGIIRTLQFTYNTYRKQEKL